MNSQTSRRLLLVGFIALGLCLLLIWSQRSRRGLPDETSAPPIANQTPPEDTLISTNQTEPVTRAAARAKIIGITNFAALTPAQLREFERVVAPGVSNFIALLQRHSVSRFEPQPIGQDNFLSLHDPKPGNIWDLKLRGNNGRDYFLRFNQTQEMGHIAGLTNVVSFFPINGPSIQDAMSAFPRQGTAQGSFVTVRSRSEKSPETIVKNVSREILLDLGQSPAGFIEIPATTERASGISGGHIVAYRPKGLAQPDNALYDTTFGFTANGGDHVLDTFTHNSARLLAPHLQKIPPPRLRTPSALK
jgi:hypothetical protein